MKINNNKFKLLLKASVTIYILVNQYGKYILM